MVDILSRIVTEMREMSDAKERWAHNFINNGEYARGQNMQVECAQMRHWAEELEEFGNVLSELIAKDMANVRGN